MATPAVGIPAVGTPVVGKSAAKRRMKADTALDDAFWGKEPPVMDGGSFFVYGLKSMEIYAILTLRFL